MSHSLRHWHWICWFEVGVGAQVYRVGGSGVGVGIRKGFGEQRFRVQACTFNGILGAELAHI